MIVSLEKLQLHDWINLYVSSFGPECLVDYCKHSSVISLLGMNNHSLAGLSSVGHVTSCVAGWQSPDQSLAVHSFLNTALQCCLCLFNSCSFKLSLCVAVGHGEGWRRRGCILVLRVGGEVGRWLEFSCDDNRVRVGWWWGWWKI